VSERVTATCVENVVLVSILHARVARTPRGAFRVAHPRGASRVALPMEWFPIMHNVPAFPMLAPAANQP
jgi:hypothetical protein